MTKTTTVSPRRTLGVLIVLSALSLAVPRPAIAGSCAADYLVCLNTYSDFVTSASYHEKQCWGDYVSCIWKLVLRY